MKKEIILKIHKEVSLGKRVMILTGVSMLRLKELPTRYISGFPYCYLEEADLPIPKIVMPISHLRTSHIRIGEIISCEELDYIQACGERLKEINEELRREDANWKGNIEIRI